MSDIIYLDSHSTTPVDPRVLDEMIPYFTEKFGNASSIDHVVGHEAANAVESARERIASTIHANSYDIVFTSGATESNNLAIKGVMERNMGNHLITCATEHKAVLDTVRYLESKGTRVTILPVDEFGIVSPEMVESAITDDTVMISIMTANNEIGTIPNISEIGKIAHEKKVLFHTDAAQAVGHIPIDVNAMNIDIMSFSSHKIYGPKGIGALYIRGIMPRVKITPMINGGEQERNIRSGTLNVPSIVGFAKAVEIAHKEISIENSKYKRWICKMNDQLSAIGGILNGHPEKRLSHNLNMRFEGVDGKAIINSVSNKLAISAGSACTTQMVEPSHVLMALGLTEEQAHSSIRIGCGRFNTDDDIDVAIQKIIGAVRSLVKINSH